MKEFQLMYNRKITIGRARSNDIVIEDNRVSSLHAVIEYQNGKYNYIDQNSTNGSYLKGKKVANHILANNEKISVGKTSILFSNGIISFDDSASNVYFNNQTNHPNIKPNMARPNEVKITDNFVIGRASGSALLLAGSKVSRQHIYRYVGYD